MSARTAPACRGCGAFLRVVNVGRGTCDPCDGAEAASARRKGLEVRAALPPTVSQQILAIIANNDATVQQLVDWTGRSDHTIRRVLWDLMADGKATRGPKRDGYRTYRAADLESLLKQAPA